MLRSRSSCGFFAMVSLLTGSVALAQVDAGLEEVVITAEKRASTVQDTPISLTAFTGADLAEAGINGTNDLANLTPGLTVQKEVIGKVVIRGIGTENFTIGSDPGVAIHKDGVYLARSSVSIFDFYDVSRIEVLRGPQGTLYGRNATGGVINILSNEPTDEFGGYAKVDIGNFSKQRVEAAINGAFSDAVQGRLSLLYAQRDGYSRNVFPGAPSRDTDELDNQDLLAVRGQLNFNIGDAGSLLLQAEISRDDSLPPAFKYFEISPAVYWFDPMRDANLPDLRTVSQGFETSIPGSGRNVPGVGKADQDSFTARLKWDFANLSFTSLTGYRETDFDWINDGDGFDTFFVNYFQSDRSEQITQEFQLTNSGNERLNWIAGLYYLNEKSEQFNGIPFLLSNLGFPAAGPGEYILWDAESEVNAFAVFGQMTYAFTDRLKGTFGLRYNKEKKEAVFAYDLFDLGVFPILDLNDDWSSTTPRVVFDFDFTDDVMGYFSATRGFKSGGYNFIAFQGPYDPEKVWAYELGLKSKLADGKVVLNLGAFFYDYEDLHVGKVVNLSASVVNADKAKIKGMEAELRAAPMPGFEISASIALLDTEYEDFVTEDPGYSANPMAPGAIGCGRPVDATTRNVSLAGCELPRAPDVQGTLGFSWKKGLANGGTFNLRGDYAYRGKQFFTQFNRANVSQDGYGLVNLRVGYGAPDDKWAVTLYGDNLADEEYFSTVLESGVAAPGTVVPQAILGPPRTYGVVFQYNF